VRILGVDYGSSRTGLALSDPLGVTCRPFGILAERDEERLIQGILRVALEEQVSSIVVGLPRPLSGKPNRQMENVLSFVSHLVREAPVPVRTWDERFTTSLAQNGRTREKPQDAVAACYMLQSYLDTLTTTGGE
jgi:putative Holliday junction resolvase